MMRFWSRVVRQGRFYEAGSDRPSRRDLEKRRKSNSKKIVQLESQDVSVSLSISVPEARHL